MTLDMVTRSKSNPQTPTTRVLGYTRVSTQMQAQRGESLQTQESRIRAYAEMNGLPAPSFFHERGVSGTVQLQRRPVGAELLTELRDGDVVISTKLDRMFRSAADALNSLEQMKQRNITLHLIDLGGDCTGNGVAKLVFHILAAVAEAERERITERILEVKARQREEGQFIGGRVPFGWVLTNSGLAKDDSQQKALARMRQMKRAKKSLRDIAAAIRTEFDLKISHTGVARVLSGNRVIDAKGYSITSRS
jgi:putative DNA-invertase from lambdoid prophage Rac